MEAGASPAAGTQMGATIQPWRRARETGSKGGATGWRTREGKVVAGGGETGGTCLSAMAVGKGGGKRTCEQWRGGGGGC